MSRAKYLCLFLCVVVGLAVSAPSWGAITYNVFGITVKFTGFGNAYYDPTDDTLTVEGGFPGNITITVTRTAFLFWPEGYVDVYLLLGGSNVGTLTVKAFSNFQAYVTGAVNFVNKVSFTNGNLGGTDFYGNDGVVINSFFNPAQVTLKNGWIYPNGLGVKSLAAKSDGSAKPEGISAEEQAKWQASKKAAAEEAKKNPPAVVEEDSSDE
ncbi:MAG: hypothetical protein HUU16_14660 [Candidatus Omnitrophica bacterium]|nr:hypothetical protein [Candidatus Omnitrophota bacterium]